MSYLDPNAPEWTPLLEAAWTARANAFAPYSHFQVGAALLRRGGQIVPGCNVENASYGGTICAERNAVCAAVAQGMKVDELEALAIVTEADELTPPCGLCRQVLVEFGEDFPVLLANRSQRSLHRMADLLPLAFSGRNFLPRS